MKKNIFITILFLSIFFSVLNIYAQEIPPLNNFSTEDYGAENQNWSISQSDEGFMYFANNKGLLEYNGASWRLYDSPNQTITRSVAVFKDRIFTGCYMDFGFWLKNKFGVLEYTSIVKNQNINMLEDEQVWDIIESNGWLLFKTLERIYLYNLKTKEVKFIETKNRINKLSKVGNVIYYQEEKKGLFKIENGLPKLVSNNEILKSNKIVEIFDFKNELLILTEENGFFLFNNYRLKRWKRNFDNVLEGKYIYSAKKMKNDSFAIGTISNGLIILNSNGKVEYQINQSSGLINNTVLSVFEDKERNIWLGLDNGIVCVNNESAFSIYNKKSDLLGTIYTSVIFDNKIYLGTNQGLFYKERKSKDAFQLVKGTEGQVWFLTAIAGDLFCGHDSGTFIIKKNIAKSVFNKTGVWYILKIGENKILQGSYDGLYVLKKENLLWSLSNKIKGFNTSSKYVVKLNENTFFINHEYKGVFKLTTDINFSKIVELKKIENLEKGIHSSIVNYNDKLLYATKKGVFEYDEEKNIFSKDSLFSRLISKDIFLSAKLVHNASSNKLWFFSKGKINYVSPGSISDVPQIKDIYISELIPRAASGYENIVKIIDEKYLIGTSNGYINLDLSELKEPSNFNISINKINSFVTDEPKEDIHLVKAKTFSNSNNNFEFFYSVPNYSKMNGTKYQYYLEGLNKGWSATSSKNSVLFKNIPSGNYIFNVRAIINGEVSKNIASFKFKIDSPWYLYNSMIAVYLLLSLLAFYMVHIASSRYYKKQREVFLEKTRKEAELKELENNQQIIKLNNEKLRTDIDAKNNELAISTMNIIKKNEFLSYIKTELINGGDKSILKVVKIIDKDLNNSDDWKMFQEAFNNADKNFLKKVKDKHNILTPNDLRLCAYLRLNLSSKEIAPLLNISPRSVEVKRYRLRKKMSLPHNINLTNYILEI